MEKPAKLYSYARLSYSPLVCTEEKWLVNLLELGQALACFCITMNKIVFCLQTFYLMFIMRFLNLSNGQWALNRGLCATMVSVGREAGTLPVSVLWAQKLGTILSLVFMALLSLGSTICKLKGCLSNDCSKASFP